MNSYAPSETKIQVLYFIFGTRLFHPCANIVIPNFLTNTVKVLISCFLRSSNEIGEEDWGSLLGSFMFICEAQERILILETFSQHYRGNSVTVQKYDAASCSSIVICNFYTFSQQRALRAKSGVSNFRLGDIKELIVRNFLGVTYSKQWNCSPHLCLVWSCLNEFNTKTVFQRDKYCHLQLI